MMMRLQKYNIEVKYEHGTQIHIADMLFRAYLPDNTSVGDKEFPTYHKLETLRNTTRDGRRQGTSEAEESNLTRMARTQEWSTI